MPTQQLDKQQIVQNLAKRLDVAIRSLRLYPPEHVICREAISGLHASLVETLAGHRQVCVSTRKKALHINDVTVITDFSFAAALVNTMRLAGVQKIAIEAGFRRSDLYELLSAFCMDAKELRAEGGLAKLLDSRGADHIRVTENKLTVVEPEHDSGNEESSVESVAAEASAILEIMDKPVIGSADKRFVLIKMSGPNKRLEKLMEAVANHGAEAGVPNDLETASGKIVSLLPKLSEIFANELPDDRSFLNSNLVAALMLLPKGLRDKVLTKLIVADQAFRGCAKEILKDVPNRSVSSVVWQIASDMGLSPEQTADLIAKAPLQGGRLGDIASQLDNRSDSKRHMAAITSILTTKSGSEKAATRRRPPLPRQPEIADLLKAIVPLNQSEKESLSGELRSGMERLATHAVVCLMSLLVADEDNGESADVASALHQRLDGAFQQGRFDVAALIVATSRRALASATSDLGVRFAKNIMREACDQQQIGKVLAMLTGAKRKPPEAEVLAYFKALERQGVNSLLTKLAVESDAQIRKTICLLLRGLGVDILGDLVTKLDDGRWYLVRNVVVVLGSMRTPHVIPYLQKPLRHSDARVRFEVATAAAAIGGAQANAILSTLSRDSDGRVRKNALTALVKAGGAGEFVPILSKRDPLYRSFAIRLDICRALESAADRSVLSVLQRLTQKKSILFRNRQKALAAAASKTIAAISARGTAAGVSN